jgi:hypothetical protein
MSKLKASEGWNNIAVFESPIPQTDIAGNQQIKSVVERPIAMHFGRCEACPLSSFLLFPQLPDEARPFYQDRLGTNKRKEFETEGVFAQPTT